MDKATTALIATEDNAAAINALGKSLRTQIDKNATVIEGLGNSLKSRTTNKLIIGAVLLSSVTFGAVTSDGTQCVIISFGENTKRTISFGGKSMGTLNSPAILVLPAGTELLSVSGTGEARALLLAGSTEAITK